MANRHQKILNWKMRANKAFQERARLYSDSQLLEFEKYTYNQRFEDSEKMVYDINLVQVMLRRLVAATYFRDPSLLIRSHSPDGDWAVPVITRLWNTKMRQLGLKQEMRMCIQDTFTCGWGIMKLGYDSQFVVDASAREESETDVILIEPTEIIKQNRITPGNPWWLRVHPADVALEYGARNVLSARWCVHRYMRQIDDLKADDRLENTRDLHPDTTVSLAESHIGMAAQGDLPAEVGKDEGIVLIYEIRDLATGKIMIVPANQKDRWLYNDTDEITRLTNRLPVYFVVFNPLSKSPYGCSTIDLLDKPQKEFNDIRTQDAKQRRISILKIIARAGLFDKEQMENLTAEDVGVVVESSGGVSDQDVRMFQPHQGQDMLIAAEAVRRDMREMSGLGRVQMGEQAAGRHTATESAQVQGAHDLMIGDYRNIVSDVILDLVQDAHKLIAGTQALPGFWTQDRYIDLIGPLGARIMKKFKGSSLKGDYSFEVSADTSPPPSRALIKQERAAVFQALGNHPRVNQDYLLRWVAEVFPDLDGNRLIIPEKQYNEAQQQTLQASQQAEREAEERQAGRETGAREQEIDGKLAQTAATAAVSPPSESEGESE